MESILVFIVSIALVIISVVTMTMNMMKSTAQLSSTLKAVEQKASVVQRTDIVAISNQSYQGGILHLTVQNEGQVDLNDFNRWDVIAEEQDGSSHYLDYSSSYPPGITQWAVRGIYVAPDVPEAFDLNILNPGEQLVVGLSPDGIIENGETIKITLSTGDGVTSQCYITNQVP